MAVFIPLLLIWLVIVYLPFAMRGWPSFLGLCAVYLGIVTGVGWGVATFTAAEVPAFLVFLGNFWLDFVVWALPVPILARAVVLSAKSLGLGGKGLVLLNVVGILALPGTWFGKAAFDRWERRPAPAECTARPILLTLADSKGSVPWSNALRLYLGSDIRADGRYLFSPEHRRSICRDTSNGAERLTTSALSVELWNLPRGPCGSPESQRWEELLCTRRDAGTLRLLPHDVVFFDPEGIRLGDFAIPKAATDESFALAEGERLILAAGPEGGTVKAVCQTEPAPNGSVRCQMRRDVGAGVSVYWDLYADPDVLEDRLLKAEGVANSICASIFNLPGCTAAASAP